MLVSVLCIGLNVWAGWETLTRAEKERALCGDFPNCESIETTSIGYLAIAASAGLAGLGVFGIVEFARRGSARWSGITIASTVAFWALFLFVAFASVRY